MNIPGYLYMLNKNNSFKLNTDDLKDVKQEIDVYLLKHNYNDLITKKTVLSFYLKAVNNKIKLENLKSEFVYTDFTENDTEEIKERRLNALKKLKLNDKQTKILLLLIEGYTYPEIRKRLHLNQNKLKSHVMRIKKSNL